MSSTLGARETNRLHRWAMWRMTVNEGIISCICDSGTMRVIYPESASDASSLTGSEVPDFHEFPFITPEQMTLARKLNLREKYGSNHGLSDDAYFIFGLPRISVGKDIPEVTSTGTRSVYESFSELGDAGNRPSSRGVSADNGGGGMINMTYSEVGPTPDAQSLASHNNDVEVQRINGYREEAWKGQGQHPPAPRLNLYSIEEEFNNNNNNINPGDMINRYSSNRYQENDRTNPRYSSNHYSGEPTVGSYSFNHNRESETVNRYPSRGYLEEDAGHRYLSRRYKEEETQHRIASRYQECGAVEHYPSSGYHDRCHDKMTPSYSVKEVIDRYESANRDASGPEHVYPRRQISSTSSDRFNRNSRSAPHSPAPDIYPAFSQSRQNSRSPTRRSYSPLPSSPRHNCSPLPSSPSYSKQSHAPSGGNGNYPSGGGQRVSIPGYGNKMRPTSLLRDGESEKLKRQAYYDWTTPTNDRFKMEFPAPAPARTCVCHASEDNARPQRHAQPLSFL